MTQLQSRRSLAQLHVWLVATLIVAGCALKPTRVVESTGNTIRPVAEAQGSRDIVVTPQTVVLDVREPFAFATSHIKDAQWLDHRVFRDDRSRFVGALPSDLSDITRKLARMGIGRETPVVVIGMGPQGHGEEGRVAWVLHYAGVNDVKFATQGYFHAKLTANPTPERESVGWWDPVTPPGETVSALELREIAKQPHRFTQIRLVDVRPERDYLGQEGFGKSRQVPDIGSINVPWTDIVDRFGRPNEAIVKRLSDVGISRSDTLLLLSAQGYESATVLLALKELGFQNVTHVAAGLEEVLATWSQKKK